MEPKIVNLQFEPGEKLGLHTLVKFYGKSNGDNLDALKRCSDLEMGHEGVIGAKISKKLEHELGEELDHRYTAKFHRESNGDGFEALKRCLDPEVGHYCLWPKIDKF